MLPADYGAQPPVAGLHGSVPEFRAPGKTIALHGGFYHFSPPEPSNALADLDLCTYREGRYTVNVASYQLRRTGKYHVYAEWTVPDTSGLGATPESTRAVRYLTAQSDDEVGQQEALTVVQTFRPEAIQ